MYVMHFYFFWRVLGERSKAKENSIKLFSFKMAVFEISLWQFLFSHAVLEDAERNRQKHDEWKETVGFPEAVWSIWSLRHACTSLLQVSMRKAQSRATFCLSQGAAAANGREK